MMSWTSKTSLADIEVTPLAFIRGAPRGLRIVLRFGAGALLDETISIVVDDARDLMAKLAAALESPS